MLLVIKIVVGVLLYLVVAFGVCVLLGKSLKAGRKAGW